MASKGGTSRAAESNPDVFINHRGTDVKNSFVSHLDPALRGHGWRTFLDANDIKLGRDVDSSIHEALKGSRVFVAIISEGFAESRHCLNELCEMIELTQLNDSKYILPVFYGTVEPRHLRKIEDGPFKKAFERHEKEETKEQILKWKKALCNIAGKMGLESAKVRNEAELISRILVAVRQFMDSRPGAADTASQEGPGDHRLNALVLGDPKLVEDVLSHYCGADSRQTPVEDHVNLRETRNSSSPMCLYSHTKGINRKDFTHFRDIRNFVKARNEMWRPAEVEALWSNEVGELGPRIRPASPTLFPDSTLRLHVVWFACRNLSDLPHHLDWPKITEKLCGLPVQILIIEKQRPQDLDTNLPKEFNHILEHGSDFFPHARKFMEDLIVKVALQDEALKGELWHKCLAVKTRVEIENAANIIWEIRRNLGSAGRSFQRTLGGATSSKKVSLSRSGEFVLRFLCTYWDIPQDSLRRALQSLSADFISQPPDMKVRIEPCKFVEFCLKVAAIILYHAQESARKPNVSSKSSLDQLLQKEAQDCYKSYFAPPEDRPNLYDKMVPEDIRLFLERIFERPGGSDDPCPMESVDRRIRSSFISKILKLIRPR